MVGLAVAKTLIEAAPAHQREWLVLESAEAIGTGTSSRNSEVIHAGLHYKEGGVRVVPGSYLARPQADGFNPGAGYIRVAMVQDSETTAEALHRLVRILG